jgi:lipopolysaccharide transport system permease protein
VTQRLASNRTYHRAHSRSDPLELVTPATTKIDAKHTGGFNAAELWRGRDLLRFLAWRDIKVRYKQTAFGAAWAIVQPLIAMLIFTLVFGRLAKVPSDDVPYAAFAYTGLVAWTYFSVTVGIASNSLVESQSLLTKVYFPRVFVPAAAVIANLLDLGITIVVLGFVLAWFRIVPPVQVMAVPFLLALLVITVLGTGMLLSAVNVRYRDVRYALPFLLQIWLFASPVVYPSSLVDSDWRWATGVNPMSGIIEGLRWAILDTDLAVGQLLCSIAVSLVLLATGSAVFRRTERSFADVV